MSGVLDIEAVARPERWPALRSGPTLLALLLLALAGLAFWPTYLSRLGAYAAPHHLHAAAATAWLLLLAVQAWLAGRGGRELHRLLGWSSVLVAPLFLLSGWWMIVALAGSDSPFAREHGPRIAASSLVALAWFGAAWALALRNRRRPALHRAYLLSTLVVMVPPIADRLLYFHAPWPPSPQGNLLLSLGLCAALALLAILRDAGPATRPFRLLLGVIAGQLLATMVLAAHPAWRQWLAAIGDA